MYQSLDDMIANFRQLDVKDNPATRIPRVGDKVVLNDEFFSNLGDGKEVARVARLPYCTVESVSKIVIGSDGDYEYMYEIYVEETGYMVGFGYDFYKE